MSNEFQGKRSDNPTPSKAQDAPRRPKAKNVAMERANTAWKWIGDVVKKGDKTFNKRYGTLARKLPSYLQINGLGQTFAFLFSKGSTDQAKADGLLLYQLTSYLKNFVRSPFNEAMEIVLNLDPAEYRRATHELMALAEWLKRFADGCLDKEDS